MGKVDFTIFCWRTIEMLDEKTNGEHNKSYMELIEEISDYSMSLSRCNESGWFYEDKESSWLDNLVDPKTY